MTHCSHGRMVARGRSGKLLTGCLIAIGMILLIAGIAAYFVATNWRGWAATGMKTVSVELINQADIPAGEKPEMIAHVESYADLFEAGDVNAEQFVEAMKGLGEGSLIPVGIVYGIDEGYLKPSGLSEEEKTDGTRALQRFARGLHDSTLQPSSIKQIAAPIGYEDADGSFHLNAKSSVNDDMLRETIANAKAKADEAGIADEAFVVDLSDELKKVLDASRGLIPGESP
ncbi:MAG: hypothetical protein K8E66_14695 [Phycisphaerales bacterium]|nr:hypothetical protein [Phycisphaerales bacterium]